MMGMFGRRFGQFLGDADRSINTLGGGKFYQSMSGSAGRACGEGGGIPKPWGPVAVKFIEKLPLIVPGGAGHCKFWAETEQKIGELLTASGMGDL